jgi:hypothetical protein
MKKNVPTIAALTIIVSAGLALAFLKLNIIQTGSERSAYTAALFGALIGAGFYLVLRMVLPGMLERGPLLLRRNMPTMLAGAFAAIAVAVIGSFMDLWSRPFLTALGWGLIIGVAFGVVYWLAVRFAVKST